MFDEVVTKGIKNNKTDAFLLDIFCKKNKIRVFSLDKKHSKISKNLVNRYGLDFGEAESIALAIQLKKNCILMDESLGRNIAKIFDIKPNGTLRFILELYNKNEINEAKVKFSIEELLGKNFRLDTEVLVKFWELYTILP